MPTSSPHPSGPMSEVIMARMRPALELLLEACACAQDLKRPPWQFALSLRSLERAGLTETALRWLSCQGYVEHAIEIRPSTRNRRRFRHGGQLTFSHKTCLVLTPRGILYARSAVRCTDAGAPLGEVDPVPTVPQWHAERRELRVGGQVVKVFKRPAPCQEIILASFQELGWPPRLDDPLPIKQGTDAPERLNRALKSLNGCQQHRLIRFFGDGTGRGLRWEWLP